MIQLTYIAEQIETGLNTLLGANPSYTFQIWADAGEMMKAIRTGNTVSSVINGNLRSVSSTNEGNILVMGATGLMLDFIIPIKRPKTSSTQTDAELQKITDGQYSFVEEVRGVIDGYFQTSRVITASDDGVGNQYTVSLDAGVSETGAVDILPVLDECLNVSVYINLTFLQGGINARDIVLYIDGVRLPFSTVTFGRANRLSSDAYSNGNAIVKNLATATALSIEFAFPATSDNTTQQAFLALLEGKSNVAHFVQVDMGSNYDGAYMMIFDNLTMNAQGVMFAGITGSLIEVADRPDLFDVPDYMQVGRFVFNDSTATSFSFTFNPVLFPSILGFIAGEFYTIGQGLTVTVDPSDFIYDPVNDVYYVYMITNGAANVYQMSVGVQDFQVVKEAS